MCNACVLCVGTFLESLGDSRLDEAEGILTGTLEAQKKELGGCVMLWDGWMG